MKCAIFGLFVGVLAVGSAGCADGTSPTAPTTPASSTYTLSGTVTDAATGGPLQGAVVRILGGNNEITSTNLSGGYVFSLLSKAAGKANVEAAKDGYQARGDQISGTEDAVRNFPLGH
jgi:hypothetical protein